jgi:hypothetical protein
LRPLLVEECSEVIDAPERRLAGQFHGADYR